MSASANKRVTLLTTLGIGALTLAYAFLVFLPGQRRIAEQQRLLGDKQNFVVQSSKTGVALTETRQKLEQARQYVDRWRAAAPDENQAAAYFGTLNRFARQAGVKVTHFEPQPHVPMQTIGRVDIALGFEGSFERIHELFRRLESLEQTIWIEELSIREIQGDRGNTTCEVTLAVFTDLSRISD